MALQHLGSSLTTCPPSWQIMSCSNRDLEKLWLSKKISKSVLMNTLFVCFLMLCPESSLNPFILTYRCYANVSLWLWVTPENNLATSAVCVSEMLLNLVHTWKWGWITFADMSYNVPTSTIFWSHYNWWNPPKNPTFCSVHLMLTWIVLLFSAACWNDDCQY